MFDFGGFKASKLKPRKLAFSVYLLFVLWHSVGAVAAGVGDDQIQDLGAVAFC